MPSWFFPMSNEYNTQKQHILNVDLIHAMFQMLQAQLCCSIVEDLFLLLFPKISHPLFSKLILLLAFYVHFNQTLNLLAYKAQRIEYTHRKQSPILMKSKCYTYRTSWTVCSLASKMVKGTNRKSACLTRTHLLVLKDC